MEKINLICDKCKHFTILDGCGAFPGGFIPNDILESNEHNKPLEGQKNNLVFEVRPPDFVDPYEHVLTNE